MDWGLYLTILAQVLGGALVVALCIFIGAAVRVGIKGMHEGNDDK